MNQIKNNLKYFSKLSFIFLINLVKVYGIGVFFTFLFIVLGSYFLIHNIGSIGHSGPFLFFAASFTTQPVLTSLYLILCIFSVVLIPSFAMKYSVSRALNKIINDKSESILNPILDKLIQKYKEKQPDILRTSGDYVLDKARLISELKDSSENKIMKTILSFTIKKIKLEEFVSTDPNVDFYENIKVKIFSKIKELAGSSMSLLFILIASQILILILIYFFKF